MEEVKGKHHGLILDNRKKLSLSGVDDVFGFNEETVSVATNLGGLIIKGSSLHISMLNLDSGEVEIEGNISALQYTQSKQSKSVLQRIFS